MKDKKEVIASRRGYVVTEEGCILNKKGIKLNPIYNNRGYLKITLRVKDKFISLPVHRLQAFQKYGEKLFCEGVVVRHLNGVKSDNSWENVLIGSMSENAMDIPEQIRIKRARFASSHLIKYNKEEIKKYHLESKSYKRTMSKFNISSKGTLHHILNK